MELLPENVASGLCFTVRFDDKFSTVAGKIETEINKAKLQSINNEIHANTLASLIRGEAKERQCRERTQISSLINTLQFQRAHERAREREREGEYCS